ncbi:hypothetical protein [Pseudoalteromonas galatheae]|uniref:hypothetical protein n=1 Tax=Pseudoalteromonas galatheae TaxID=579562 RepID=UPI0030CDD3CF
MAIHKIQKQPKKFELDCGYGKDCLVDFTAIGANTLLEITRNTKGNQIHEAAFTATYSEAVEKGWLSDDHGTMEYDVALAESELGNFPSGKFTYSKQLNTYGVLEEI